MVCVCVHAACVAIASLASTGTLTYVVITRQVKAQIATAVREYVESLDVGETSRCLSELGMPFYHWGVVVAAVELAFETEAKADALCSLLAALSSTGVINQTQVCVCMCVWLAVVAQPGTCALHTHTQALCTFGNQPQLGEVCCATLLRSRLGSEGMEYGLQFGGHCARSFCCSQTAFAYQVQSI